MNTSTGWYSLVGPIECVGALDGGGAKPEAPAQCKLEASERS